MGAFSHSRLGTAIETTGAFLIAIVKQGNVHRPVNGLAAA